MHGRVPIYSRLYSATRWVPCLQGLSSKGIQPPLPEIPVYQLQTLIMSRTGRYKPVLLFGTLASSFSYTLLFLSWHGDTSPWEALYIFPSGFGTGIAQTAVFTSIQASIDKKQRAPALAGMYLMLQLGLIIGLAAVSATVMETVRWKLDILLGGLGLDASTRYEVRVPRTAIVLEP